MPQISQKVEQAWRVYLLCLILFVVAASWPTAAANEERTLDLIPSNANRPFTTIMVNGVPATALLDTGATIALIDQRLISADWRGSGPVEEARVLGIGGERLYPVARLGRLSAGTERWNDVRVAVNTEARFPVHRTILPVSIFDTRVVDFDFANHRVHLYNGSPRRVHRLNKSWLSYQERNDLMFITVRINGVSGTALVDTGADVSFVNSEFAEAARGQLDEVKTQLIRGSDLSNNRASVYKFRQFRFGKNQVRRLTLPVLDTDLFDGLGYADQPMMIMGMDVLRQFRMQVDRDRRRIYFLNVKSNDRPIGSASRLERAERGLSW